MVAVALRPQEVDGTRTPRRLWKHWFNFILWLLTVQLVLFLLITLLVIPSADVRDGPIGAGALFDQKKVSPSHPLRESPSRQPLRRQFVDYGESLVEESKKSLDDYYERPHFPFDRPAVLIIGGSDGSGTRAFVQSLMQLGVPIVYDDEVTFDVHGRSMADGDGWPKIVSMVLDSTHSANYNLTSLPDNVRETALLHLTRLKKELTRKAKFRFSAVLNATPAVLFAFKAPVTMLLLPLLTKVFGFVKFLHVVRDGRDVALSANQSPIKKFYDFYYRDHMIRRHALKKPAGELQSVMAMQLWNDWNLEALEWEHSHANGQTFDFITMRTEDLVDPKTKLNSLLHLATFVGLQPLPSELCCMTMKEEKDMGLSVKISPQQGHHGLRGDFGDLLKGDRGPSTSESEASIIKAKEARAKKREKLRREQLERSKVQFGLDETTTPRRRLMEHATSAISRDTPTDRSSGRLGRQPTATIANPIISVQHRYGRWATTLRNRTELSFHLHREGAAGLKAFGYEPALSFLARHPDLSYTRVACQKEQPLYCSS